ncbi:MAG: DUF1289 domain-containing protein [Gammaproteobacteria bacterium]
MESPCIGVCMINADTETCHGCYRTLDEIACWASYPDAERTRIMQQLARRRAEFESGDDEPG